MKQILLFTTFAAFWLLQSNQLCAQSSNAEMVMHMKDSTLKRFPLDDIARLEIHHEPDSVKFGKILVYARVTTLSPYPLVTSEVNSFTFEERAPMYWWVRISPESVGGPVARVKLFGDTTVMGFDAPLQSLTFETYAKNLRAATLSNQATDCTTGEPYEQSFISALWLDTSLVVSPLVTWVNVDRSGRETSRFQPCPAIRGGLTMSADAEGKHALFVDSRITVPQVGLKELDLQTGVVTQVEGLEDSTISRGLYYSPDTVLYYRYGSWSKKNRQPSDAGFFLFDRRTKQSTLLLPHVSYLGYEEAAIGFDLSPDKKTLLFAATFAEANPKIVKLDLEARTVDTLPVDLFTHAPLHNLWLRYSHDGTQLLYSKFPLNTFTSDPSYYPGEVGIIHLSEMRREILDVSPTTEGRWVHAFPEWSPDDKRIVYGTAHMLTEPEGLLQNFQIAIYKLRP